MRSAMEHLAHTDALTSLGNRRQLEEHLGHHLGLAQRYGTPLAVLAMDIDRFKHINDTYGHPAGDAVLKELAQLLGSEVRWSIS